MRNSIRAICAAATVLAVAGCGGGGGGAESQPAPMDGPPALTVIGDQSIDQDTSTAPISFSVDDRETAAGSLVVTVTSSDTGIVAADGLVLGATVDRER